MEARQMTSFFPSTFSDLLVIFIFLFIFNIHSEFENTQNSFSCSPSFGPFWSVKYLNFGPKATNSESSLHFYRK